MFPGRIFTLMALMVSGVHLFIYFFHRPSAGCFAAHSDWPLPYICQANGEAPRASTVCLAEPFTWKGTLLSCCVHADTHLVPRVEYVPVCQIPVISLPPPTPTPRLQGISRFGNGFTCKLVSPCCSALSARHLRHAYLSMSVTIKSICPGVCLSKRCFIGMHKQ